MITNNRGEQGDLAATFQPLWKAESKNRSTKTSVSYTMAWLKWQMGAKDAEEKEVPPTILQRDLASSENLLEYSSSTSLTSRSTSSLLIFFFLCWKGDWPSIISYSRQPSAHQSGLRVYRSFFTTSGAGGERGGGGREIRNLDRKVDVCTTVKVQLPLCKSPELDKLSTNTQEPNVSQHSSVKCKSFVTVKRLSVKLKLVKTFNVPLKCVWCESTSYSSAVLT